MLHALPALLDDLERRLIQGEDPLPLLGGVRWSEIIDWPTTPDDAFRLKARLSDLQGLILGLQAPLQATLMGLNQNQAYRASGRMETPAQLSVGLHQQA